MDKEIQEKIDKLRNQVNDLSGKLEIINTDNKTLKEQVVTITKEKETIVTEKEKLSEGFKTVSTENSSLKENQEKIRIKNLAFKELGDYKFKNNFEKIGFESGVFNKIDGKFRSDEEIKKDIVEFLKATKPIDDKKTEDKKTNQDDPKDKTADDKKNQNTVNPTRVELQNKMMEILKKPSLTKEDIKEVEILEKEIEKS